MKTHICYMLSKSVLWCFTGISAADQAKLFEPYSFVTSGWVLKAGVSGLGLSMAKRFVERAGGSIGVESTEGSGSTFFFSIPFPLVPVDLDSEREQPKVDPVAALLQKSEVTQSTSSSGVTVVHESITVSRRRSNMSSKEDLKPSVKTQPMQIPEDTHEETDVIQRKVLLVEDTRINRVSCILNSGHVFSPLILTINYSRFEYLV